MIYDAPSFKKRMTKKSGENWYNLTKRMIKQLFSFDDTVIILINIIIIINMCNFVKQKSVNNR